MKSENIIPAFPVKNIATEEQYSGMDLRDYFAAKAMQAELSLWRENSPNEVQRLEISEEAYKMADSMMEVR